MEDRFVRQSAIIPQEKLDTYAMIVGVGAIGRQVAMQLAAMGITRLILIDPDKVELHNCCSQGYYEAAVGEYKAFVTRDTCKGIYPAMKIRSCALTFAEYNRYDPPLPPVIFSCVDSMSARAEIWDAIKGLPSNGQFFVDTRMAAEFMEVYTVTHEYTGESYGSSLFSDAEAYQAPCTAKSTIYCANMAAAIGVSQLSKWFRDMPLERVVKFNLFTMELFTDGERGGEEPFFNDDDDEDELPF